MNNTNKSKPRPENSGGVGQYKPKRLARDVTKGKLGAMKYIYIVIGIIMIATIIFGVTKIVSRKTESSGKEKESQTRVREWRDESDDRRKQQEEAAAEAARQRQEAKEKAKEQQQRRQEEIERQQEESAAEVKKRQQEIKDEAQRRQQEMKDRMSQ